MSTTTTSRSRWAAFGAAVAVAIGGGGILTTDASIGSGERAVYVPITPCRLFDTRPAPDTVGARTSPLGPNETLAVAVRGTNGRCTIPADAAGLVMNVAIVSPTDASFLTVFPSDAPLPLAANANWLANDPPKSNAVTADISADGRVSFYNLKGTVHIAVDIVGYYVDHTHDDRYYTKAEGDSRYVLAPTVLTFSGHALQPIGAVAFTLVNECGSATGNNSVGRLPLTLPVGARITSFDVRMFDGPIVNPFEMYAFSLVKMTAGEAGAADVRTNLVGASGGLLASKTVVHTMPVVPPETVEANESFSLDIAFGQSPSVNGVCQLIVRLGT